MLVSFDTFILIMVYMYKDLMSKENKNNWGLLPNVQPNGTFDNVAGNNVTSPIHELVDTTYIPEGLSAEQFQMTATAGSGLGTAVVTITTTTAGTVTVPLRLSQINIQGSPIQLTIVPGASRLLAL